MLQMLTRDTQISVEILYSQELTVLILSIQTLNDLVIQTHGNALL